jgi:arylsulfatase A-like enzyme/predicted Zn-dependent protease
MSKKRTPGPRPAPPPVPPRLPRYRPALGRRWWLVLVALVVAAAPVFVWLWRSAPARPADGPIILISIDTLRADHLPSYGYRNVETPVIDALAREAVVFDRAYAHSPQTLPSHTSILSGQLPFETGVRDNVGFTVGATLPWLPDILRQHGFTTGGVVSAFVLRKETGVNRGFDFFDGDMPPARPDKPMGQVQRAGTESLAVAERWMSGLAAPRFFLFFHLYEPHAPYEPPARFAKFAPYDGEIAFADEIVGQLLDYLRKRGWYDRATIVLLSDHGEGLGDHGELEHGLFVYQETIRVPLVVRLPGGAHGGHRVAAPVQHIDVVPTLLDYLGIDRPPKLRGRSLRDAIESRGNGIAETPLYAESLFGRYHFGWSELYALTDARYRFIRAPRQELYDIERDPGERQNIAAGRQPTATAMRAVLDRLLAGVNMQSQERVSKADLERLQALGYVGTQPTTSSAPGDTLPDPKDKAAILGKYRRAAELSARRQFVESIALYREILAGEPQMKDVWLQLGEELLRAGRYAESVDAFKRLVELDPSDPNGLVSVATVLVRMNRLDEAAATAETALRMLPETDRRMRTSALEVLVNVALQRKDAAAARASAARASLVDPDYPLSTYVDGVILYDAGRYREALPLFQQTAKRLEARTLAIPNLYYYMGDIMGRLGEAALAEVAFETELKLSPENLRARAGLAMLYRAAGRAPEAERIIDSILRVNPTPEGYEMAAKLWTMFGEKQKADALRAEMRRRAVSRVGAGQ